ncbi:MAG TPA: 2-dehydro-3-deoxyphosphooctonate aldolase, partial [Amaricoccus sp.]|nr:2-dehydro-3-deoxyphosphooctonate aldolase [Amaricoccus sp.]
MPFTEILSSFSAQDALVAAMVGVSASDENMTTKELLSISRMVDTLPIFEGYDKDRLRIVGQTVFDLLTE